MRKSAGEREDAVEHEQEVKKEKKKGKRKIRIQESSEQYSSLGISKGKGEISVFSRGHRRS